MAIAFAYWCCCWLLQALVNDKRFRIQSKRDPRGFKRSELEKKEQEENDLSRLYNVQGVLPVSRSIKLIADT